MQSSIVCLESYIGSISEFQENLKRPRMDLDGIKSFWSTHKEDTAFEKILEEGANSLNDKAISCNSSGLLWF